MAKTLVAAVAANVLLALAATRLPAASSLSIPLSAPARNATVLRPRPLTKLLVKTSATNVLLAPPVVLLPANPITVPAPVPPAATWLRVLVAGLRPASAI